MRPPDKGTPAPRQEPAATLTDTASTSGDFFDGYRLGYATGYEVGYAHGVTDEGAAWSSILTGCADTWRQPNRAELEKHRAVDHQPCRNRCGRCSRCAHADAWQRRGARPYLGVDAEAALARGGS